MGYLTIIRRHAALILLFAVGACLAAAFGSLLQQTTYTASTTVQLSNVESPFRSSGGTRSDLTRAMRTQMDAVTSDNVRAAVARQLGRAPHVVVTPHGQTDELEIQASAHTAKTAAAIANAYGTSYVAELRRQNEAADQAALSDNAGSAAQVQQQIDAVAAQEAKSTGAALATLKLRHDVLVAQLKAIGIAAVTRPGAASALAATTVRAAIAPSAPSAPRPVRAGVLGLFAGLIIGFVAAALMEAVGGTVGSRADVARIEPKATVLGAVTVTDSGGRLSRSRRAVESIRPLRASVTSLLPEGRAGTVAVIAASDGDEASPVAAGLAYALALARKRVTVLDCDIVHPRQHELFSCEQVPGLVELMSGALAVEDLSETMTARGSRTLRVVPAGGPGELDVFAGPELQGLVDRLLQDSEVVVIDAPANLDTAELSALTSLASITLVVVEAGRTRRHELAATIDRLRAANGGRYAVVLTQSRHGATPETREDATAYTADKSAASNLSAAH